MANLTIAVDDEVLKRARIRALEQGSSVNALLREYLEVFAGEADSRARAIEAIARAAARSESRSEGRRWTRDELYER